MKTVFHGGIHPAGRKELSRYRQPDRVFQPTQVVIPLRQHIGSACEPLVKVGDTVALGQKIGDGEGMCVPIHASVSGRVVAIEEHPHPGGGNVKSVVIKNDGRNTPAERAEKSRRPWETLSKEEILGRIREGGVVGMGGAAFPTGVKADVESGQIDTLIVNACECEPYITADDTLLSLYPTQVLNGAKILAKVLEPMYIVMAVEDNKTEAIAALRAALDESKFQQIHLEILPARYPQGGEKQLIYAVTGREVPSGKLPKDVGAGVFNAATCAAVSKAVDEEIPLVRRIVTVTGEGVNRPMNLIVPIGTPVSELIEEAGGLKTSAVKGITGGPMMGRAQETLDIPVVKGTNAISCLVEDDGVGDGICIHCGLCVGVCPMHLQPLYLYQYSEVKDLNALKEFCLMDCIECGCCTYVCPGKIPLVRWIREGKSAVKEGGI